MGFGFALVLGMLAVPGSLVAALVNPRRQTLALLVGAATSAAIVVAIIAATVSRI